MIKLMINHDEYFQFGIFHRWYIPSTCPGKEWCSSGGTDHSLFHRNPLLANFDERWFDQFGNLENDIPTRRMGLCMNCSLILLIQLVAENLGRLLL